MKLLRSSVFFAVLALGWMGLITYTSSLSGRQLKIARTVYVMPHRTARWAAGTNAPSGFWGVVDHVDYTNILDKPVHAAEFAVLMTLWWSSFILSRRVLLRARAIQIASGISLVFSALDEYHQSFVPGRQMTLGDLTADAAGVLAVAVLVHVWRVWRRRRRAGPAAAGRL